MANGLPYYKRYPRDFIEGCVSAQLTFEQRGAYAILLDLIYVNDGRLPDDPRYISGVLACSVRKWKSIRDALVQAGKLNVARDGESCFLTNERADYLVEWARSYRDKQAENGSKPKKNNRLQKPSRSQRPNHTESESIKGVSNGEGSDLFQPESQNPTGSPPPPPRRGSSAVADPPEAMVEIWNAMAARTGLPKVQKLTDVRAKHARARLERDLGGSLDQWRAVVARVGASSFLRGEGGRDSWKGATWDWLTSSPNNLAKVMEGQYDDAPKRNGRPADLPRTLGGDEIWYGDPAEQPVGTRLPAEAGVRWDWRRQQVRP